MAAKTIQVRINYPTYDRVRVLAGAWGMSTQEAIDRVVEAYVLGDPKVQALLKAAGAANGGTQ